MGDEVTVVAGFDTGGVSVLRTTRRSDGKGKIVGGIGTPIFFPMNFIVDFVRGCWTGRWYTS